MMPESNWKHTATQCSAYDVGADSPTERSTGGPVIAVMAPSSQASWKVSSDASASCVPTDISQLVGRRRIEPRT
jgi:hypothetical protein